MCVCIFLGTGAEASSNQDVIRANGVWLCLSPSFTWALTCLPCFTIFLSPSISPLYRFSPISLSSFDIIRVLLLCTSTPHRLYSAATWLLHCCMYPLLSLSSFGLPLTWPLPFSHIGFLCSVVYLQAQISSFKHNNTKNLLTMWLLHWNFPSLCYILSLFLVSPTVFLFWLSLFFHPWTFSLNSNKFP